MRARATMHRVLRLPSYPLAPLPLPPPCAAVVRQLQVERGLALVDILTEISKYTMRVQLPRRVRMRLLDRLMQIECVLSGFARHAACITDARARAGQVQPGVRHQREGAAGCAGGSLCTGAQRAGAGGIIVVQCIGPLCVCVCGTACTACTATFLTHASLTR